MSDKVVPIDRGRSNTAVAIIDFENPFNIVSELSINRQEYTGGEPFTVSGLPRYVSYSINRVREQVAGTVHLSPVVSCCISRSLELLIEHPEVVKLVDLKSRLNKVTGARASMVVLIHKILETIPLTVPSDMLGATRPRIRLPEEVKKKLNDTSGQLGVHSSTLAVLCVIDTLESQSCVLPEHRTLMQKGVEGFYELVEMQSVVAEVLIGVLLKHQGRK